MSGPPAVKDLPKMGDSLKGELLSPRHLKETTVAEKNVLPTAEDVAAEKTHQGLIDGVEKFDSDKLHHVKTREPASGAEGEFWDPKYGKCMGIICIRRI